MAVKTGFTELGTQSIEGVTVIEYVFVPEEVVKIDFKTTGLSAEGQAICTNRLEVVESHEIELV